MKRIRILLVLAAAFAAPSAIGQGGPGIAAGQSVQGELSMSDSQRRSGKYEDVVVLQGRRGERIQLDLSSSQFDPYLAVTGPGGFALSNDDAPNAGESLDSRIVFQFPADGAYRIQVTSFRPGETGGYQLRASVPAPDAAVTAPLAAAPIAIGGSVTGDLSEGDGLLADRSYADHYRFTARRGQRVAISLASTDFDPMLFLTRPDGEVDSNDDSLSGGQPTLDSRIDTVLAEDGDYVITVNSYRPRATGKYRLDLALSPGHPRQIGVRGGPRVLALLVGVSDYGGRTNNLPNTDADARELYTSLQRAGLLHPASAVLVNDEATTKNVAAAFRRAAAAVGPDDLFLFFFSGHGNQVDVPAGAAELDGRAETLGLHDTDLTDADLAPMFASVRGRMSMLVIDACFAGGFRSLIDRPGTMGLFSSEEDLTSLVASRFKAGGFLSYFLRTGLAGEADDDGDRIVTAGELATYVRRRFRREGDIPAQTREDYRNYQNLLIERGGVQVEDVVVRLGPEPRHTAAQSPAPAGMPSLKISRAKRSKR